MRAGRQAPAEVGPRAAASCWPPTSTPRPPRRWRSPGAGAVGHPTEALRARGRAASARDAFAQRQFPDDVYDLVPRVVRRHRPGAGRSRRSLGRGQGPRPPGTPSPPAGLAGRGERLAPALDGGYSPQRSPSSVCSNRSHPALLTERGSKKRQPSGQANGACSAASTRQRWMTSPRRRSSGSSSGGSPCARPWRQSDRPDRVWVRARARGSLAHHG